MNEKNFLRRIKSGIKKNVTPKKHYLRETKRIKRGTNEKVTSKALRNLSKDISAGKNYVGGGASKKLKQMSRDLATSQELKDLSKRLAKKK